MLLKIVLKFCSVLFSTVLLHLKNHTSVFRLFQLLIETKYLTKFVQGGQM